MAACQYDPGMSQSFRHRPIVGYGKSEKKDKLAFHRKWRRKVAHVLKANPEAVVYPEAREVTNTRRWRKDPRGWHADTCQLLPQLMRK